MPQCNSSRFEVDLEREWTVVLWAFVGFVVEPGGIIGSERNDFPGTRQGEEPDLLAEFIGQGGEEGKDLGGHCVLDMST